MRSICGKVSVTFVAVLALCALASASASAAQWYVNGKALSGSAAISPTVKVQENVQISLYSEKTLDETFTCTTVKAESPSEITAPTTLKVDDFLFGGCKTTYPVLEEECKPEGGEIGTYPVSALLGTGTSPEDKGELAPVKGKYWTGFNQRGCLLEGAWSFEIYGKLPVKLPQGQTSSTEQELVFEKAPGLYNYNNTSEPIYITGKVKLKLTSGSTWSLR